MHKQILSPKQQTLLPLIKQFAPNYCLIGGTAIALYIGHRYSIDFDLITNNTIQTSNVLSTIKANHSINSTIVNEKQELTLVVDNVKITFLHYPYKINTENNFENIIKIPSLLSLGAMKAFALGKRAKWKDYVDLYFIFKKYSLSDLVDKAKSIFKNEFNEKLFREQLAYFKDIDYSEQVDYADNFQINNKVIEEELIKVSLQK
jgi:hypothetical protein